MRGSPAGRDWRAAARRFFARLALLLAAFSSLATSDDYCPQIVSLSDTATVEPDVPAGQHYTVSGAYVEKLHVLVKGASAEAAEVRVRLEPDDPARFVSGFSGDAGPSRTVELALRPGVASTAHLELPRCLSSCDELGLSVIAEHVAGAAATLSWELFAETEDCDGEFHVLIERD